MSAPATGASARSEALLAVAVLAVLAVVIVPLALLSLARALKARFELHRKIARWTWPLWMYVSVTGVIVYLILYKIFPEAAQSGLVG